MDKSLNSLPKPNLVEPATQRGHQDGQGTQNVAAFPGSLAIQVTEPSYAVRQSWLDMVDNPSDISRFGNDRTASGSTSYINTARMNQRVNTGNGNSIPQQEWGHIEGFLTTRSENSLNFGNDHDDSTFGCLQAAFKGLRLVQQIFKHLEAKMMVANEEQISRGPDYAVGRNPKVCRVCKTRVVGVSQIPCCHIVCQQCLPFNDGKCRVCKEPVEDTVAYDIHLQNVAR